MIGYHANDEVRCNRFLQEPDYLIISEKDTEYLGTGMYFWEHLREARWWATQKKNDSIKEPLIVKASIRLTNLLDLTDYDMVEVIKGLYNLFGNSILRNLKKKYPKQDIECMTGAKLDELFEACPIKMNKFEVVRCQRAYPQFQESDFFYNTKLTTQCITIYCVKVKAPISNRELA